MSNSGRLIAGILSLAALVLLMPATIAQALPAAGVDLSAAGGNGHVIKVHDRWRDDDDDDDDVREYRRHRHSRDYYRDQDDVVEAPFTHVTAGRRGRHIVAPFVNIWIPR